MKDIQLIGCIFLWGIWACGSGGNPPPPAADSSRIDSTQLLHQTQGHPILLVVSTREAIVRAQPQLTAPELRRVAKGDSLIYANSVTDFNIAMQIDGIAYQEPWLKVILDDSRPGWIYGGCVRFDGLSHTELSDIVLDQRLRQLFGNELTTRIVAYRASASDIRTQEAFDLYFQQSEDLRSELLAKIGQRLSLLDTAQALPDFFWLNSVFPGFVVAYPATLGRYTLFRDYGFWAQQASQTTETADDSLVSVFLSAYPQDSIEFLYADWKYALSETETYSRLGEGIHLSILQKMDVVWRQSPRYQVYLKPLLRQLLDDISLSESYWQPIEPILFELDALLQGNYAPLSPADKIELKTRYKMLQKPEQYGVRLNAFEG